MRLRASLKGLQSVTQKRSWCPGYSRWLFFLGNASGIGSDVGRMGAPRGRSAVAAQAHEVVALVGALVGPWQAGRS